MAPQYAAVMAGGLTIDDSARYLRHATWIEGRLFEVVGEWVRTTPEPAVKLAFARQSRQHGWHAQLLEPLRPETRDHDIEDSGPLDPMWRTLVARLLATTATGVRLDYLAETLRLTLKSYEDWMVAMSPVRDEPVRRVLRSVVEDERAALAELEALGAAPAIGAGSSAAGR